MTRRLLAGYLTVTILVLAALEVPLGITNARNQRQELTTKVERDAVVLTTFAEDYLEGRSGPTPEQLGTIARDYQRTTGARVVIVDANGVAIVDSDSTGAARRSFASRPEIAEVLARGTVATGVRHSNTLGTDLLYVAVPVASGGAVHGAVRLTYPMAAVDSRVTRYWLTLAAIAAGVLAAAALVGLWLARSVSRPLADVEHAASAASTDLRVRASEDEGPPEVRSLAASLNRTVARLEELVRSREAFVADASHQLRTPLAALRLRLENLERDVADPGRADLEAALAETARLGRLVDGLLLLARADSATAEPEPVELAGAIEERLDAWSVFAAEHDVRLDSAVGSDVAALATPGRIEQVLDNLLANALDVAPAGSTITVSARETAGSAELHVVDEGPGMSAEARAHAFDRFWRGDAGVDGFGLGLAIVHRLVTSDGGNVELRAAPGGGIDAVVSLPRAP